MHWGHSATVAACNAAYSTGKGSQPWLAALMGPQFGHGGRLICHVCSLMFCLCRSRFGMRAHQAANQLQWKQIAPQQGPLESVSSHRPPQYCSHHTSSSADCWIPCVPGMGTYLPFQAECRSPMLSTFSPLLLFDVADVKRVQMNVVSGTFASTWRGPKQHKVANKLTEEPMTESVEIVVGLKSQSLSAPTTGGIDLISDVILLPITAHAKGQSGMTADGKFGDVGDYGPWHAL